MAQENQQRIDGEKKTVEEAKEELDEHKRTAKEVDCQYVDVRNRIEQLAEETEPLKVL